MVQPKEFSPSNNAVYTYASNTTGSKFTFREREIFRELLFDSYGVLNSFDFWGPDRFYGRANTQGNAILLSDSHLKQLKYADGEALYSLNFVADAWGDFADRLRRLVQEGVLFDDGPYAAPLVTKAWHSPIESYHQYMLDVIYPAFSSDFIGFTNGKKIKNIQDFIFQFGKFCENTIAFAGPITLSGYLESIYSSPLNTGLVLEISDDSHADDFNKEEAFFYDGNFEIVSRLASHYGFAIDKNAPWRFCADLSSPVMVEYMTGVIDQSTGKKSPYNQYLGQCDEPVYQEPDVEEPYGYSAIPGLENTIRRARGYEIFTELANSLYYEQEKIVSVVFGKTYNESWTLDMEILKYYLAGFYNVYVEGNPYLVVYNENPDHCSPYRNTVHVRQGVSPEQFSLEVGQFGGEWALSCYYYIRMLEKRFKKTKNQKDRDTQSFLNVYRFSPGTEENRLMTALQFMQERYIGPVLENRMEYTTPESQGIITPGGNPVY